MPLGNDLAGPPRGQAQFLCRRHALAMAGRQRIHIRLQIGQLRGVALDAVIERAQKPGCFAALQCNVARSFAQIGQ